MAVFQVAGVRVSAISAVVPAARVRNANDPRFAQHVGVTTRRVAPASVCASDLCIRAAQELLARVPWSADAVGALLFVTQTPDYPLPGNSMLAQRALGLPSSACLLDLHQGCAGYVYGLATLASVMSVARIDKGLLLVGDTITRLLSTDDSSTVPLFSDAGSATLLEASDAAAPMYFDLGANGAGASAIQVKAGGARQPYSSSGGTPVHLSMRGLDVLDYVLTYAEPSIRAVLTSAERDGLTPDYYVFHQANAVLNRALTGRLGIGADRIPETLSEYGNTSCASIPVTMCSRLAARLSTAPSTLLLSGFGTGFSWGSALIGTDRVLCPDVVEFEAEPAHVA